jgi:hypothetical protein
MTLFTRSGCRWVDEVELKRLNENKVWIHVAQESCKRSRVLYSRGTDKAEDTVLLLSSADHTENKSRDSYLASLLVCSLLPNNKI